MNGPGSDNRPVIVPLGGFLGSGKTTLILAASRVLQAAGKRPAAILNDQGNDLVDTQLVQEHNIRADQVTGGCFCCRFSDLVDALDRLREFQPDVIFAEAVGSCTDISSTTLQPLKRDHATRFRLAPFTVTIDSNRSRELLSPEADPDMAFLFRNQLEEADLVCFTKSDLRSEMPTMPGVPTRLLSAKTGQGVAEWLDEILGGELTAGGKLLDINYARYAQAEAALSWLNCRAVGRLEPPGSPAMLVGPLLDELDKALTSAGIRIAHLKVIDECATGYIKAGIALNGQEPDVEGALDASPCDSHELILNIRAVCEPDAMRRLVENTLAGIPVEIRSIQCFRPSAPIPQHRVRAVILK